MPTRQQLESALRNADRAGDVQAARALARSLKAGEFDTEDQVVAPSAELAETPQQAAPQQVQTQPAQQPAGPELASARQPDYGAAGVPLELMAAINRGATRLADFLTTDQINAVAQILGSEFRAPSITEAAAPATAGGFMEPGTAREVVRGAGEAIPGAVAGGGALSAAARRLPALAAPTEGVTAGAVRQLGQAAPGADIGYGAAAGAGMEVGREVGGEPGALVGAVLAPVGTAGAKYAFDQLLSMGGRGVQALMRSVEDMSEEGAATLLANAMVREGLSPEDVAARLQSLGPEAMPADVGTNFARLLRTASNMVPRIEGRAGVELGERQAGQAGRLTAAFEDAAGVPALSVDDEIVRLNQAMGPRINELYREAGQQPLRPSPQLRNILEGDNSVSRAMRKAQSRLSDKRAAGDEITNIDVINATKQELDDQIGSAIRQGKKNKARDLIRLKNTMIEEVDEAIPQYKAARDAFAGKASLENAADLGQQFFKLKPRDVESVVKTLGDSEKRMFRLGAKQALIDKLDTMQINRDAVKALFGRGGDVKKLRAVFDTDEQFERFSDALEREANFILTRRAAQANSTTAKQLYDEKASMESLESARAALGDPTAAVSMFTRIMRGLKNEKGSEANVRALEQAGDILLERGMDINKLTSMLRRGSRERIESELRKALPGIPRRTGAIPVATELVIDTE